MSVEVSISVPAADFLLAEFLNQESDVHIQLERTVELGNAFAPSLRIEWENQDLNVTDIEATLRSDPDVVDVALLETSSDTTLTRIEWESDSTKLIETIIESKGSLKRASGTDGHWFLQISFGDSVHLSEFHKRCREHEIPIFVERLHNPNWAELNDSKMTRPQYDALRTAFELGYFKVPREVTLEETADKIGISDTAMSQRLRRGCSVLITESQLDPTH